MESKAQWLARVWSEVVNAPFKRGEQKLAAAVLDGCLADLLKGDVSQLEFLYDEEFDLWCNWLNIEADDVRCLMLTIYSEREELLCRSEKN